MVRYELFTRMICIHRGLLELFSFEIFFVQFPLHLEVFVWKILLLIPFAIGIILVLVDYQKERSTQVFILCDKPKDANLILISFRGTEPFDVDDWSTDFDYSWYEIPKLGKVHMGFLEALGLGNRAQTSTFKENLQLKNTNFNSSNGVDTTGPSEGSEEAASSSEKKLVPVMAEMTAYFAVRSKLKSLLKEHKKAKFMVTGHSLGGALAILFPTVLLLHEEKEVMQSLLGVHTFGQPRVGNRKLGRFVEAHLVHPNPKYFRVVYCNDLVPRLPYDNQTFLYKHVGVCLYYNSFYAEQVNFLALIFVITNTVSVPNMEFAILFLNHVGFAHCKHSLCLRRVDICINIGNNTDLWQYNNRSIELEKQGKKIPLKIWKCMQFKELKYIRYSII